MRKAHRKSPKLRRFLKLLVTAGGEWIVTKAPTDTENCEEERVCKNDPDHKETSPIRYDLTPETYQQQFNSEDGMTLVIKNLAENGEDDSTFGRFSGLYVNGEALTQGEQYTVERGSIIIRLLPNSRTR